MWLIVMWVKLFVEFLFDFGVFECVFLHDLGRVKLFVTVHDGDLAGELGQKRGLLHRRVAVANDDDLLILEEETIARRAARDAVAPHQGLVLEVKLFGVCV